MSIRDREALNPDTLIAVHLLNEFYDTLSDKDEVGIGSATYDRFNTLEREILDDVLWRARSLGKSV